VDAVTADISSLPPAGYPDSLVPHDPEKPVTIALGDANLAWRATHEMLDAWGSDLFCPNPPPIFQLHLVMKDSQLQLVPSLQEVRNAVLSVFNGIIEAGQSIEDLGAKVIWMRCTHMREDSKLTLAM
jgi:hypothetical protein